MTELPKMSGFIGFKGEKRDGQSLAEFGLILGLVVLVSVAGVKLLGGNISQQLQAYVTPMNTTAGANPGAISSPYSGISYDTTAASAPASPPSNAIPASTLTPEPATQLALISAPQATPGTEQTTVSTMPSNSSIMPTTTVSNSSLSLQPSPSLSTQPSDNQTNSDQSGWANATPGCMGCTQNMNGNWGW